MDQKCVYISSRGIRKGTECENSVELGTQFCKMCRSKVFYDEQQYPFFRHALKEWDISKYKDDLYLSTKYYFILKFDQGTFSLVSICPPPDEIVYHGLDLTNSNQYVISESHRNPNNPMFRPPTEDEKQKARVLGILAD